jgi:peptidoglycan/LPS O-acetylase OafA/YrhL
VTAAPRTALADGSAERSVPRPLHQLTGLRLFAALAVYFSHVAVPKGAPAWLVALQQSGYAGVTFFFVLSGFVLALNYFDRLRTRPEVWSYAAARLARVYPLYLVALAWPSVHRWAAGTLPEWHLLQKVLGLQAWNPDVHVAFGFAGPAWSISVELFLYATLPLLVPVVRALDRRAAVLVGWIAAVLVALTAVTLFFELTGRGALPVTDPASAHRWLYRMPLVRLGDFALGILAARLLLRIRDSGWAGALGSWLIVGSLTWTVLAAAQPALVHGAWSWDALYAPPSVALILGLALAPAHPVSRLLSLRLVVFLGEVSFAFYLMHKTVIEIVGAGQWQHTGLTVPSVVLEATKLGFAAMLAVGLHVGVERPARTVVRRWLDPSARRPVSRQRSDEPDGSAAGVGRDVDAAVTEPIPVVRPRAAAPGPRTGEAPVRRPLVPLG